MFSLEDIRGRKVSNADANRTREDVDPPKITDVNSDGSYVAAHFYLTHVRGNSGCASREVTSRDH